jgi:hypothetical protein
MLGKLFYRIQCKSGIHTEKIAQRVDQGNEGLQQ